MNCLSDPSSANAKPKMKTPIATTKNLLAPCLLLLLLLTLFAPGRTLAVGTWTPLVNQAPSGINQMFLLPDGTVMGQHGDTNWYRLTPDTNGSYVNGTWTTVAPMHDSRTYYSGQVLRDGRVLVCGGEYGTGADHAEIYQPTNNTWTPAATPPNHVSDTVSDTLPDGNVLEGFFDAASSIYNIVSNTWSAPIVPLAGQNEASWVKLQDGSILTIDPFGTNTERFIPGLNQWVQDNTLSFPIFGWGGEIGAGFLLPNGKAIFFGGTGNTAIYTPWTTTNGGVYTPAGATNMGTWTAGAIIPNTNAPIDAPGAMMVNGKILCIMADTTNGYGVNCNLYEYDYVANAFTQVTNNPVAIGTAYGTTLLVLPDGTVLCANLGSQLYSYKPDGSPLASGVPVINSVSANGDGSYHVTGTLFNGITEGAAYGDDVQDITDYPLARITNSFGALQYARTYNWSTCNLMTGTNLVTTEMVLPAGLLAGTYPLVITANGNSSAPFSLAITGTLLPPVTGLASTSIASSQMTISWSAIGLTEASYIIQRSTNGADFSTIGSVLSNVTSYVDTTVTPLGQYYYRVFGTNAIGLGNAGPVLFAASSPAVALPGPWQAQDVGAVPGSGASGQTSGTFTVIGSGSISGNGDQFQYAFQPIAGDLTITARVTAEQNTGANTLAGVMIRNGLDSGSANVYMAFDGATSNSIFGSRAVDSGTATSTSSAGRLATPYWVRLARSGNTLTGYTSPDGSTWTPQGSAAVAMEPVVYAGVAVSSGNTNLLNTSTFDNVTIAGTAALISPATAYWKLDETSGTTAVDSRGGYNGTYNNVILAQPGATPDTGTSVGFNGKAQVLLPPLNLNTNVLTITAWVNPNGNQSQFAGIFFNNIAQSGITFGSGNQLGYMWNFAPGTYGFNSGLVLPPNQWTFVALVIEPTRARLYTVANGVLSGATNNLANVAQAFNSVSTIGNGGYGAFNGLLDEVAFYGNQALAPAQISQLASTPSISITTPSAGAGFAAPATVGLAATVTAIGGDSINLVQFFNNGTLVGQSASAPYTNTLTGLQAGSYTLSARLFYDSGLALSSDPLTIFVQNPTITPQNVVATALASNLVNVTWSPSADATGYIVSRNGTLIAGVSGTGCSDVGLAANVNYCYSVVATNLISSSIASASSCVNTLASGGTLAWDAGSSSSGPRDGSDNWSSSSSTWWNGSANVTWTDNNLALIGLNGSTNSTITINSDVTPSGIVFNSGSGGSYTLTGANNLIVASNLTITADANASITAPLSGNNNFTKTGPGTLVLNNGSPAFNGIISINAGAVEMQGGPPGNQIGYVVGTNGILRYGYDTTPGYDLPLVVYGAGVTSSNGLYIGLGAVLSENSLTFSNAPTTVNSYGSGPSAQLEFFDGTSGNLYVTAAASGSVISSNVNINMGPGYATGINTESGANTLSGDLVVYGLLVGPQNPVNKYGAGSLRLTGPNTYSGGTVVNAGSLQLASSQTPLGSGPVNYAGSGTLQAVVGSSLPNTFSINSGVTMTVDTLTNSLTILGAVTNAGSLTKIGSGTLALAGANTYTGATAVNNGTLQLDGSLGATAVTVANTATLAGVGMLATAPTLESGSILSPGDSGIGTLTISAPLTLASSTLMELSKTGSSLTNDLITVSGELTYGGALTVTNLGPGLLANGDSFKLFSSGAYASSFTSMNLPSLTGGLVWVTSNLTVNGSIAVVGSSGVNTTPTNIVASLSGKTFTLFWPADHTGWRLLAQTNNLANGISLNTNDWGTVSGSASTNLVIITIDPTKKTEFYRLVYP